MIRTLCWEANQKRWSFLNNTELPDCFLHWQQRCSGRFYICSARSAVANNLLEILLQTESDASIFLWFVRVPSPSNPFDGLSQGDCSDLNRWRVQTVSVDEWQECIIFLNQAAHVITTWQSLCARIVIVRQRIKMKGQWQGKTKANNPSKTNKTKTCVFFFCLDAAWLNEGRCPCGRPSVS